MPAPARCSSSSSSSCLPLLFFLFFYYYYPEDDERGEWRVVDKGDELSCSRGGSRVPLRNSGGAGAVRCWSDVIAVRFQGRRRRHGHEHGDHGDGLLGQRLLRALRLRQAALRAPPPQDRRSRRARRRRLRPPNLQHRARDPRAGAVRGDELPDGQARGRRAGAGGVAVHGVPGGVRGEGRGARAPRLRPCLPRRLHRRLAPAAAHLPRLPRLPARRQEQPPPRHAARPQPRRREGPGLLVRRRRRVPSSCGRGPA